MKNKTLFEQYLEADSNRQELLKKYNAKTLVEVNKEDYNSLYNEIIKLIN